ITTAVLLLVGTVFISLVVFAIFDFSLLMMFEQFKTATPLGEAFLHPGNKFDVPLETLSLNLGLVLGTAGLPHILIRFYT
ncbi:cation acetate symporter, partial [Bacillus altitudinis]|uniref:sodium:solute symporter family transporter n=1 Tax=Bacillus altitudinis TaxID=293387 RepID=UPI003AFF8059|nr:cation acetate symporter [Bacillus altitudinis]